MFTFVLHILSSRNITKNMLLHKITPNFTTPVEALVGHVILEILEMDFPSNPDQDLSVMSFVTTDTGVQSE